MTNCLICQREDSDQPRVCTPCRVMLDRQLAEIPDFLAEATQLTVPADSRRAWRLRGAHLGCANLVYERSDPVAAVTPSGPTGSPGRVRVTGTRTAPLPVSVELLDLVGPGTARVSDSGYRDQIGELPPAVWLDQWATDWASMRGDRRPVPTVAALSLSLIHI